MVAPEADVLGLYVHVPFCAAICNYCNFNRGLFDPELKARYVDALVAEIGRAADAPVPGQPPLPRAETADTVFFGGGTPSLLTAADVARILAAAAGTFDLTPDAEITLEANPETVTEPLLRAYRDAGVTRISFGVQSFSDAELTRLSRLHGADRARGAVREARAAGFDNVSLDLMMWLPGQAVADWLASVDAAVALAPDHLSLYLLELYPNAPLREEMARRRWSLAPDDDAATMYLEGLARLDEAGYEQYEISNVARPGRRSRHNLKYWQDGEWRGFGCGAHSTCAGVRWKNVSATEEYIECLRSGASPAVDLRRLTGEEQLEEALFTGLRLVEGLDLERLQGRYGVDVWSRYGEALKPFVDKELLVREACRLRLTREGMLLANEVMQVFV
ncbi:MAG: radical SAM family heme chaperone HemW [Vicinamibacterales bacterium]